MKIIKITLFLVTCFGLINAQEPSKPAITPYWGFGHWIWEDQIHTSNTVKYMIDGYSKYDIPVSAVILDSPWSSAYNNFKWDSQLYPDFKNFVTQLHKRNIKLILWYTGFVNKESWEVPIKQCPSYVYAVKNNYTVNDGNLTSWHKGKGAHIDFTNTEAVTWWHTQVDNVLKLGIDGWKVDISAAWLGDSISTSIGILSNEEFRPFYYKDAFEYSRSINPDFLCYTYGHANLLSQHLDMPPAKYSHCQWVGDFDGDFTGLTAQLEFIYKSAKSGYGAPACEIGGYWGKPSNKKSIIRYTQLASMVPTMVNGGNNGAVASHLPWNHDEQTILIYRKYVNLHLMFAPYLFSNSVDGYLNGHSIIKGFSMEQKSHLLGDDIFVKAITTENDSVKIVFPDKNKWINYWDFKEVFSPSDSIFKYYTIEKYPIFIKAGAIIPVKTSKDEIVEFMIFPNGKSKFTFHKPLGQGIEYSDIIVTMNEENGTLEILSQKEYIFRMKLVSFNEPKSVLGADHFKYDSDKSELLVEKKGSTFKITIDQLTGYTNR